MRTRAKTIVADLATLGVVLVLMAAPAGAATGAQTFRFIFSGDPLSGAVGVVSATGVINSAGTDRTVGTIPNPDGTVTDIDVVTLSRGTLTIHDTDTASSFSFDPVRCIGRVSGSGPYEVVDGTGAYAGATGSGHFRGSGVVFFKRAATGCSDQVRSANFHVTASGTISFP